MDRVNMTQAKHKLDRRIGMVSARLEHLLRIESYGLQRIELVILHREEQQATREVLKRMGAEISVHCPLFRDCGLDDYPLHASVFDTDEERRRRSLALMERELVQAAELGARIGLDDAGVTESRALGADVLTVGKYLSPKLYVGYGVSLLGTGQVLMLKYLLRKGFDIQIESSTVENRASVNYRKEK